LATLSISGPPSGGAISSMTSSRPVALREHRHVGRERRALGVEQGARAEHDLVEDGVI